ncbi:MAG: hypothetical protein ABMA64_07185 [Myxococcota bacterium]
MIVAWAMLAVAAPDEPDDATFVYYNARMALREGQAQEVVKLWFVRNALELAGEVSPHDADFRSLTWAALGNLGICQDGTPVDEDAAGLWPLALHNWVVKNKARRAVPKRGRAFDAFQVGRQQRVVSIDDVLGQQELRTLHLTKGRCSRAQMAMISAGESPTAKLADRQVAARLLKYLLERAQHTLSPTLVRGRSAIEARLFDLHLQLAALAAAEARKEARERAQRGRTVGLSRASAVAIREDADPYSFEPDSEPARILRGCRTWPASEWMALSPERRLFLYDRARALDPSSLDALALSVLDATIAAGDGAQVDAWIARVGDPAVVWAGERGQRLLSLDPDTGFRERGVVALRRGVHQLEQGDLPSALRSLAFALAEAPRSRDADAVESLTRRWMSYVASQFALTDDLLVTLQELVSRRDYAILLEDLMWRAALRADRESFARGLRNQLGKDALARRLALLAPLAEGDVGRFSAGVRAGLAASPSETLKFLDQWLARLELEDADVRASQLATLSSVRKLVTPLASAEAAGTARSAAAVVARAQAISDGVGAAAETARERARGLDPDATVYAGSVRLAPTDPLPWPFTVTEVPAPSAFEPIALVPVEWRDASGAVVFGWSLGG